jgi:hypothetical protein
MADYTLEELKTILINLINSIGTGNINGTPWGAMMEFMSRWEEIQEFMDRLDDLPCHDVTCPMPPVMPPTPSPPPLFNKFTQIKLTRCTSESIATGGRWEASHNLKGMVVLVMDDLPMSLWYCTGAEWRRLNSMQSSDYTTYGYVIDDTPLPYTRGDTIQIPLTNITTLNGDVELSIGTQIVDKYHAIGIIKEIMYPEFDEVDEPTVVIVTWVGEADGSNLFTNDTLGPLPPHQPPPAPLHQPHPPHHPPHHPPEEEPPEEEPPEEEPPEEEPPEEEPPEEEPPAEEPPPGDN